MPGFAQRIQNMSPERRTYCLRALTTHLERCRESSKLHRLLSEYECVEDTVPVLRQGSSGLRRLFFRQRSPQNRIKHVNAWFTLQEEEGDAAAFIIDVRRGLRLAKTDTSTEIDRGEKGRSIAFEARYALILSSINDLGAGIPPTLLARLVEAGIWTLTQGLTYARQVPSPSQRGLSLVAIAAQARGVVKHEILEQAFAAVQSIRETGKQVEALANLSPHLCATLLLNALTAARTFAYPLYRVRALTSIVPNLPEPLNSQVLQEALSAIQEIKDEPSQAECLNELAAWLPPPEREEALREVLVKIRTSPYDFSKVQLLGAAARYLPESLLSEAFGITQEIRMDIDRSSALLSLAPRLAELGRQTEALKLVKSEVRSGPGRALAQALAMMAPFLKEEHLPQALQLAGKLYFEDSRAEAIVGLGPYLSGKLLRRAYTMVKSMKHEMHQVEPLAVLLRKHPDAKGEEHLEHVIRAAIPEYASRSAQSEALSRLAINLPNRLLKVALSESHRIDDEKRQVKALAVMASFLSPRQKAKAAKSVLSKARSIERERDRYEALVYVTPLIAEVDGENSALDVALSIKHPDYSAWATASVLQLMSQTKRKEFLINLLNSWRKTEHGPMLPDAYKHLATYLAETLWSEAIAFARENKWANPRSRMLTSLMSHAADIDRLREILPFALDIQEEPARSNAQAEAARQLARLGYLEDALDLVQSMTNEIHRVDGLEGIIPYLPKNMLQQVVVSVEELTFEGRRWSVLSDLAPRFAAIGEWRLAVQLLNAIEVVNRQALATARMVKHAPVDQRQRVVEHALKIANGAQGDNDDWWLGEVLTHLVPYVSDAQLERMLELALNIVAPVIREDVLSAISKKLVNLRPSDAYRLWSMVLQRSAELSRAELMSNLIGLIPVVAFLGEEESVAEIMNAIDDVGRWWPA